MHKLGFVMIATYTELYGVVTELHMSAVINSDVIPAVLKALNVRLRAVESTGSTLLSGTGEVQITACSTYPIHLPRAS